MSIVENPIRLFRIGFFLLYRNLVVTITYSKMVVITFFKENDYYGNSHDSSL